jgi:uncharacterized protein
MLFVLTCIDKENALDTRKAARDAHIAYVRDTGVVRLGGPFLDANGDMAGSLLILDVADLDAVKAWQANDPYVKAGLFARSEARAWKATANFCEAKL